MTVERHTLAVGDSPAISSLHDQSPDARNAVPPQRAQENRIDLRSRSTIRRIRSIMPSMLILLAILSLWELASRTGWQPPYILPAPSAIAADIWNFRGVYWDNAWVTLQEFVLGLVFGVFLGIGVGIALGSLPSIRRAVYPLLVASQSLPILAIGPILVLWFGYGILPKVILVVQIVFFPLALATVAGLAAVPSDSLLFGRSLGASRFDIFRKVSVPASLPYVFSGLKVSASYGAIGAVVSEWAGAERGLGALMLRSSDMLDTVTVFGCILLITAIGLGSFGSATALERLVIPWHEPHRKR